MDYFPSFSIEIALFEKLFLLPLFSASYECEFSFYEISPSIEWEKDEGRSHFSRFRCECYELTLLDKKSSLTTRIEISCTECIFRNMCSDKDGSIIIQTHIWAFEIHISCTYTFHFFTKKDDSDFHRLKNLRIKTSLFIFCERVWSLRWHNFWSKQAHYRENEKMRKKIWNPYDIHISNSKKDIGVYEKPFWRWKYSPSSICILSSKGKSAIFKYKSKEKIRNICFLPWDRLYWLSILFFNSIPYETFSLSRNHSY